VTATSSYRSASIRCIEGRALSDSCATFAELCVKSGEIAECVLLDAPACNPGDFEPSCDNDVLTHCAGLIEARTDCRRYGLVCDAEQGCVPP
jgi:hypothetical protein